MYYQINHSLENKPSFIKPIALVLLILLISTYLFYCLIYKSFSYQPIYDSPQVIEYPPYTIQLPAQPTSLRIKGANWETHNSEEQLPMASTVKLVTALMVLEKLNNKDTGNEKLIINNDDLALTNRYKSIGGSVIDVRLGETISINEALEYLLITSANNMADILVSRVFKNIEEYNKYANNWLKQNNINKTNIDDASGFSPKTTSTPSDLSYIGELALENEIISQIVSKKEVTLPSGAVVPSTNYFLASKYGVVIGIKTGNTDEAKFVFVGAVEGNNDGPSLISAVMQADNRDQSQQTAIDMIDQIGSSYKQTTLFEQNNVVIELDLPWAKKTKISTQDPIIVQNIAGQEISYSLEINKLSKTTQPNQLIGQVTVKSILEEKKFDLYVDSSYPSISPLWKLTHPFN